MCIEWGLHAEPILCPWQIPLNLGSFRKQKDTSWRRKRTRRWIELELGIRRGEEHWKEMKKRRDWEREIWSAKSSEQIRGTPLRNRRNMELKEAKVNEKSNKEGPEQAMEVEKQTTKWQGKGNNQRIRSCIWAMLQGALNLGKETQRRKERSKRHRKVKR